MLDTASPNFDKITEYLCYLNTVDKLIKYFTVVECAFLNYTWHVHEKWHYI